MYLTMHKTRSDDIGTCRNADGAIVRPMPRCKRMLSDAVCLPNLVQLLLTFDPVIVEKTAKLLSVVMQVCMLLTEDMIASL